MGDDKIKNEAEAVVRKGKKRMKLIASKVVVCFSVFSLTKIKKNCFIS